MLTFILDVYNKRINIKRQYISYIETYAKSSNTVLPTLPWEQRNYNKTVCEYETLFNRVWHRLFQIMWKNIKNY